MTMTRTYTYLLMNTWNQQVVKSEQFTTHDNEQASLVIQRILKEVSQLANEYSFIDGYSLTVFYDSEVNGEESEQLYIDFNGLIVDYPCEFLR